VVKHLLTGEGPTIRPYEKEHYINHGHLILVIRNQDIQVRGTTTGVPRIFS